MYFDGATSSEIENVFIENSKTRMFNDVRCLSISRLRSKEDIYYSTKVDQVITLRSGMYYFKS